MYKNFFKRVIDIILSLIGLLLLSWLFLIIIIAIKIDSRGPVFFKQKRVGKNKKHFYIHKFRTMYIDTPKDMPTHMLSNPEKYITKVGKFLRKTSLDELPQFWDVFIGNMSVVGPRPALYNQYDLIEERDKYHANDIRPGITGWAQINGRDELEISVKSKLDGEYAKKISFLFDVKIFFLTFIKVFKHEGVIEGKQEETNKQKKILILANKDITLYFFRQELIKKLIDENNEVYLSFPHGDKTEFFEKMGCKFIDTHVDRHGTNPIKDSKLFLNYMKILKQIKPDVVLTYTIKPNLYGGIACRFKKVKCIANVTGLGSSSENNGIIGKLINILYKMAFKKISCVFCQNKENLEYLVNMGINKNKLKLIPGSGVNLEKYKLLDYPNDKKISFLFIGRIMKAKGIDEYLEVAEKIKKKYKNTEFHILGFCEEDYQERLNTLVSEKIINYHGLQDNIIPFLDKSHCTIHPTYYPEGMSNVLLESSASGRPIITTNRSGCKEIVDNNKNGYIVKEKDAKDLYNKVEKFIKLSNKEKKEMGIHGRKKVEKEFDRNIVVEAYIKEIND